MRSTNADLQPVIVAFDGSAEAQEAATTAARLFTGRLVLVVRAWEPGLVHAMTSSPDPSGLAYIPPDPQVMAAADEAQLQHATAAAQAGARLARDVGAGAQPLALQKGWASLPRSLPSLRTVMRRPSSSAHAVWPA